MPDVQLLATILYVVCGLTCSLVTGNTYRGELIQIQGKRLYLRGERLVLNCTTIHKFNNSDLEWTNDGKALPGKKINNNTLQVIKPDLKLTDSGGYRCALIQQGRLIRSVQIHVKVGVAPPQIKNISWRNIDNQICVNWPPVYPDDFSVTYKIRYRCVTGCDLGFWDDDPNDEVDSSHRKWHVDCKNTPHHSGEKLHCCLTDVNLFEEYQGVVIATNLFGSSSSKPFSFIRNIQTIPAPPTSLKLQSEGYGEITLEWTTGDIMFWNTRYAIFYNADGDAKNKTIRTDDNGQKFYRITGLKPFTKYTVYVAAIDHYSSNVGLPVGPVSIVTREENPSGAPKITVWHSSQDHADKKLQNVTIKWSLPPKENWNGKLTHFIIQYRQISKIDSTSEKLLINNTSAVEWTIFGLRANSAYEAEMQMCNVAGCGGIGNRVVITGRVSRKHESSTPLVEETSVLWIVFPTVFFALAAMVLFIIVLKNKRKNRPTKTKPQSMSSIRNIKSQNA